MKNILKPIYYLSALFFCGCDYFDDRLKVSNNSSNNIYVSFSIDTVLSLGENKTFMFDENLILAKSKKNILLMGSKKAWEFFAEKSLNKQLHIFILSEDTLKKHEVNTIINMKKYQRRIDIGVKELEATNWEVLYE